MPILYCGSSLKITLLEVIIMLQNIAVSPPPSSEGWAARSGCDTTVHLADCARGGNLRRNSIFSRTYKLP